MRKAPSYIIINWVFFVLLLFGFLYSWWFYPTSQPFDCVVKAQTGKDCPSCGLSRAFSLFTHGEFAKGKAMNVNAFSVFLFFSFQWLARTSVLITYFATRHVIGPLLINSDGLISISLFLLAFLPILLI
ncbi:MAG: DUF2752 domain-containing protein [bacterium]|nr:DUF2752 domain-containing protein [bacterium]